jgi:hypothetical protein
MSINAVKLPCIVEKLETKKDGSVKVTLETRELPGDQASKMFSYARKEIWAVFSSDDDIGIADIPTKKPETGVVAKSKSQRLRNTLFVLWKQKGSVGEFDHYYDRMVETFIERVKDKLDEV